MSDRETGAESAGQPPSSTEHARQPPKRVMTAARKEQNRVAQKAYSEIPSPNLTVYFYLLSGSKGNDSGNVGRHSELMPGNGTRNCQCCDHVKKPELIFVNFGAKAKMISEGKLGHQLIWPVHVTPMVNGKMPIRPTCGHLRDLI
jgi:hypothetical protein